MIQDHTGQRKPDPMEITRRALLKQARQALCLVQETYSPMQGEYDELMDLIAWVEEMLGVR